MMENSTALFEILAGKKILFVIPHPDDEFYSCTAIISMLLNINPKNVYILYISHGVPSSEKYSPPLSNIYSYDDYLKIYIKEQTDSVKAMGINSNSHFSLNYPSSTILSNLPNAFKSLKEIIVKNHINVIFSCPYEGAHVDHDLTSFLCSQINITYPNVISFEYGSYFSYKSKLTMGRFLNDNNSNKYLLKLTKEDLMLKEKIRKIYKSQNFMIKTFLTYNEFFRIKPNYNYNKKPDKEIFYESWQSTINSEDVIKEMKRFKLINEK